MKKIAIILAVFLVSTLACSQANNGWVLNNEKGLRFYTSKKLTIDKKGENYITKYSNDVENTIIFIQSDYDNFFEKANLNKDVVIKMFKPQIQGVTRMDIKDFKVIEKQVIGNIRKFIIECNLNNRGFARIIAFERNTDISILTIFTINTTSAYLKYNKIIRSVKYKFN